MQSYLYLQVVFLYINFYHFFSENTFYLTSGSNYSRYYDTIQYIGNVHICTMNIGSYNVKSFCLLGHAKLHIMCKKLLMIYFTPDPLKVLCAKSVDKRYCLVVCSEIQTEIWSKHKVMKVGKHVICVSCRDSWIIYMMDCVQHCSTSRGAKLWC